MLSRWQGSSPDLSDSLQLGPTVHPPPAIVPPPVTIAPPCQVTKIVLADEHDSISPLRHTPVLRLPSCIAEWTSIKLFGILLDAYCAVSSIPSPGIQARMIQRQRNNERRRLSPCGAESLKTPPDILVLRNGLPPACHSPAQVPENRLTW